MGTEKCSCGRLKADASQHVYHSGDIRHTFFRCECGKEWTVSEHSVDPVEPITSEEVIEIHEKLAKFEGPLSELLKGPDT